MNHFCSVGSVVMIVTEESSSSRCNRDYFSSPLLTMLCEGVLFLFFPFRVVPGDSPLFERFTKCEAVVGLVAVDSLWWPFVIY